MARRQILEECGAIVHPSGFGRHTCGVSLDGLAYPILASSGLPPHVGREGFRGRWKTGRAPSAAERPLMVHRSSTLRGRQSVGIAASSTDGPTAGPVQADERVDPADQKALPVFRAVGVGWFAVNCFSAMTYGRRLAILLIGRRSLRSSDLR